MDERLGGHTVVACRKAVQRVNQLDRLSWLHRLAVRCANVEAFKRGLKTPWPLRHFDVKALMRKEELEELAIVAEIGAESSQESILIVLYERFGEPSAISCRHAVQGVTKPDKLRRLLLLVVRCPNIEAFQKGLRIW